MKTPLELRKDHTRLNWSILKLIEESQNDGYNQAIEDAVKSVRLKETRDSQEYNEMPSMSNDMGDVYVIDKESILKLRK